MSLLELAFSLKRSTDSGINLRIKILRRNRLAIKL